MFRWDSPYLRVLLLLRILRGVGALLLLLPLPASLASNLQMKIDDVKFDNGAVVRFLETGSVEQNVSLETLGKMIAGQPHDKHLTVFASIDEITVYPSFENYIFYVRSAAAPLDAPLTRFTVQAVPYDAFPDQGRQLTIHVLEDSKDSAVEISVPVHSLKSGNFLWARSNAVAKIHLSGGAISVDLVNKYLVPIKITDATLSPVPDSHWLSQPKLQNTLPILLGSDENDNHVTLVWNAQPRASGILRDSLIPISKAVTSEGSAAPDVSKSGGGVGDDTAENLEISVHYVPEEGGFPHPIKVYRSVYFYPSLPALVGVSILGAIVGGIVMFFGVRKDFGAAKFFKYLIPNLFLALFIQILAVVLFSFDNSKIQIGVVNLNPTLLIPASCLGAISVFYGFQLIEKWLGKAGSEPAKPAGGGAKP
jgi:hypothetical protein